MQEYIRTDSNLLLSSQTDKLKHYKKKPKQSLAADSNDYYGIPGCGVFKAGIQNWKGLSIKINCSQMKLLNFENWTNREPQ